MRRTLAILLAACVTALPGAAFAQCMLANPSFEVPGSGGATFGGWNAFGTFGTASPGHHGARAARVTGNGSGTWNVSAFWQPMTTAPGRRWTVSADVWHPSTKPLGGQSSAIVNIEWRNGAGDLISYESFTAADASTPTDSVRRVTFESQPAPTGTATARVLVGILEGPTDSAADVFYDAVTFESDAPDLDALQWNDFPGGRTLAFAGRTWRVKGPGFYGPGPNTFSDAPSSVWVDAVGRLHLTIDQSGGTWQSSEVALEEPLGYGDYAFTTVGALDQLDPVAVLGLFIWEYGPCYDPANGWWNPYNEMDVEFSRWGSDTGPIGHFTVQPYDWPDNSSSFDVTLGASERTTHAFRWLPDRVEFRSWYGGPYDEAPTTLIHAWAYDGVHIARPDRPRVHLNLWTFGGAPATRQEVVLEDFRFTPACPEPDCSGPRVSVPPPLAIAPRVHGAPNPFRGETTIHYALAKPGRVLVRVFDVNGRHVRTLLDADAPAGEGRARWDGRDERGLPAPPGLYICAVRSGSAAASIRLVRLR